jgi:hypothetical protein
MRRRIFLIGLLLLALSSSGWGGVLAAAFCAHDAAKPSVMTEDHDCCRAKLDEQTQHCGAAKAAPSAHEAMAMSETETATLHAKQATDAAAEPALGQATPTCFHCMSRGGLPTTFVLMRETEQKKRDAAQPAPQLLKPIIPPVAFFAPTLAARQNAPPGIAARRHLLLGVFVI